MEMARIINTQSLKHDSLSRWKNWIPKMIQQAKLESHSNSKLKRVMQNLDIIGKQFICIHFEVTCMYMFE